MRQSPQDLSGEEAFRLHQRLLERDPTAPTDLATAAFEPLTEWLQATNWDADPHLCAEAASKALLNFCEKPQALDPIRLSVDAFLRMVASRKLKNLLRNEQRHQRGRRPWNVVENAPAAGKYLGRDDDPSLPMQIDEARQPTSATRAVLAKLTAAERRVWELMQQGERRSSAYAEMLGITHLPKEVKDAEVRRVKDRVGRRMKRAEENDGETP
jgi:DNA-directed RNA polymerase specialized sigma24 family protein